MAGRVITEISVFKAKAMTFHSERVPSIENENSDFFREARAILRTGHTPYDVWTVDRERNMALLRSGAGFGPEDMKHEYWRFLDRKGLYRFSTTLLEKRPLSADVVYVARTISFTYQDPIKDLPDSETRKAIREAFRAYKDCGFGSKFKDSELLLQLPDGTELQ